jgi:alpha-ribazole phosphatase
MTDRFADLLRHGEPKGGGRFRGGADDPLTTRGLDQMRATATSAGAQWDLIVTSPTRRCTAFAEELAGGRGVPLEVWPELRERGWGDWEGRAAEQIPASDLARFWADPPGFTPPGAEPFAAFSNRVLSAWARLLGYGARHSLVVTHGGAVRVILGSVLRLPADALILIEVPYACITRLRLPDAPGRPSLMAHGPCPLGLA